MNWKCYAKENKAIVFLFHQWYGNGDGKADNVRNEHMPETEDYREELENVNF